MKTYNTTENTAFSTTAMHSPSLPITFNQKGKADLFQIPSLPLKNTFITSQNRRLCNILESSLYAVQQSATDAPSQTFPSICKALRA